VKKKKITEARENLNPGMISSVTAAPPKTCRRSRTHILSFPFDNLAK
jgi:hypothetical protein